MATTTGIVAPEWIDAKTAKQIFGIGRSTLYLLADAGSIKTSSLRLRGNTRGKRLFSYDSIKKLIERGATGGAA